MEVEFARDGKIILLGHKVGQWFKEDMWKENGQYLEDGTKLVHYMYHTFTIDGKHYMSPLAKSVKKNILSNHKHILDLANHTNDELKQKMIENIIVKLGYKNLYNETND